jgi:hypothetical protein
MKNTYNWLLSVFLELLAGIIVIFVIVYYRGEYRAFEEYPLAFIFYIILPNFMFVLFSNIYFSEIRQVATFFRRKIILVINIAIILFLLFLKPSVDIFHDFYYFIFHFAIYLTCMIVFAKVRRLKVKDNHV